MKSNLIFSLVIIAMLGFLMLNGMGEQASSAFGGATTLLHTSLDDIAAIESPTVGIGGSTSLTAADFVSAQTGNGANFTGNGKVVTFPAADGGTQNIELDRGEVEFWYRPNYEPEADDVQHNMLVVGNIYNPPNVILVEGDRLSFSFVDAGFNYYSTQAAYRADLWDANQWVHIRATWDKDASDPLRVYVNGARVDEGGATGGWNLGAEADIGSIFIGAGEETGVFSAEGVMDELIIRDAAQTSTTPIPTATDTPTPSQATNTPTSTASNTPTPGEASNTPTVMASNTPAPPGSGVTDPNLELTPAPLARPAYNSPVTEPVFGTTIRRVTDEYSNGGFGTQIYSQLQAFSPDNSHLLLIETSGYVVRRLDNLTQVPLDSSGWNAPRWHSGLPNTIVHYDSNADKTLRVQYTDVATQQTTTAFTFPSQYQRIRSNQSFDELSHDGRWMAGMASRNDGTQVMFALDLQNLTLGAQLALPDLYASSCQPDPKWGEVEPDWIGVSPLGNYLVVQWKRDGTTRCSGLESFDLTTGAFVGRAYDGHQHGDLGVLPDGTTEIFMTFELGNPDANGLLSVGYRELPGTATVSQPTYLLVMDWNAGHISCQGPNGVCLVSNIKDENKTWSALEGELFLLSTDGSVQRLVHHRSSSCAYWVQPRASLSRDGRYVIFASDWQQETGVNGCDTEQYLGRGDAYVIDLGATTAPPSATPTQSTTSSTPTATPSVPDGENTLYLPIIIGTGATTPPTSTPSATSQAATATPSATPTATIEAATVTPSATSQAATATPSATSQAATATPTATIAAGSASFSQQNIDDDIIHGQGITVVDIDQDGDDDVLVALSLTDAVYLYVNGGNGSSWTPVSISGDNPIVAMKTTVADFDDDGDLDVAAVGLFDRDCTFCSPGEVTWYENPGNVLGSWTTHPIVNDLWGARYISSTDLTGDGLPDLIVSANEIPDNNGVPQGNGLYWFRNMNDGVSWAAPTPIDANLPFVESHLVHDVDGDNVMDVIAVGRTANEIAWYANSRTAGTVNDNPTFTKHVLATPNGPQGLTLANLDSDAQLELITISNDGTFSYDPPANPSDSWTANTIDASFGTTDGQEARLFAADFDGDGDTDVAASSAISAELRWYRNNADGTWSANPIANLTGLTYLTGGDFDGNNRPDLLTSTYENQSGADRIDWWRNEP